MSRYTLADLVFLSSPRSLLLVWFLLVALATGCSCGPSEEHLLSHASHFQREEVKGSNKARERLRHEKALGFTLQSSR